MPSNPPKREQASKTWQMLETLSALNGDTWESLWLGPILLEGFAPGNTSLRHWEPLEAYALLGGDPLVDHAVGEVRYPQSPSQTQPLPPLPSQHCQHTGEERNFCVNPIYCWVSHFLPSRQSQPSVQCCMKRWFNVFLEGEEKHSLSEKSLFQLIMK